PLPVVESLNNPPQWFSCSFPAALTTSTPWAFANPAASAIDPGNAALSPLPSSGAASEAEITLALTAPVVWPDAFKCAASRIALYQSPTVTVSYARNDAPGATS